MSFPGAPAALRRFRLQHLYALHRLLRDAHALELDGADDVEIFDRAGDLVETIHVQRSADELPPATFFERARRRLRDQPTLRQRIVSFGAVSRLLQAMSGASGATLDGEARAALERFGFSRKQIDAFRLLFVVEAADAAAIEEEVHAWLREDASGIEPETALLHLSAWMAAERRRITLREVRETLEAAGRFVDAQLVTPSSSDEGDADDATLDAIDAAFARTNVAIVHGRGKGPAAQRYLAARMPPAWRFEVHARRERTSILQAAAALAAHAREIGVPLLVRLDVSPRDLAWTGMAEELRAMRGVRLLVTVGEEQWARARNSGALLMAAEVALERDDESDPLWQAPLAAVAEEDLEAYLLHAFSRGDAVDVGELRPRTMIGVAGVLRALLWLGVQRYRGEHAELIAEVENVMPGSELVWAVLDPAGLTRYAPSLLAFEQALEALPEQHAWYLGIKRRRPSPEDVFAEARQWLAMQQGPWPAPASEAEWQAAAEVLFWGGAPAFSVTNDAPPELIFAGSFANVEVARDAAVERFRRDTATITIDESDDGVVAHWVLPLESEPDVERETARRLDLLRRLYPHSTAFGGHVYGSVSGEVKRGIPADAFPVPWVLRVHLMFARQNATWEEYVANVASLRDRISSLAARIAHALALYFRRDKPFNIFEAGVDAEEWDALTAALGALPKLPRSAVDAWGFETEGPSRAWSALTPNAHAPYTEALAAYAQAMRDFLQTSWRVFVANPHIGRGTAEGREKVARWSESEQIDPEAATRHLAEALRRLERVQREFRARFAWYVPELASLEERERESLRTFWAVWYDFAFHPRRRIANAVRESAGAIEARLDERRRALRRRLRALAGSKSDVLTARNRGEAAAGLWITIDVARVPDTINGFAEALVQVIDVLRPPAEASAFDRYALDLSWEHVHLVPLVRGRSVERKGWTLRIADLPRPDEDLSQHAWQFVPRRIADEAWRALDLAEWPASTGASARRLQPGAAEWRDAMRHVINLREVPLRDALGRELLASQWRASLVIADRAAARVASALAELPHDFVQGQPEAMETLQILVSTLRETIAAAEPLDFAAIEEAAATVGDTIVPAASALADVWLDGELA